jgi:site-specific DNA recombinase
MSPSHTRKGGRLYRYYFSQAVLKDGLGACPVGRISTTEMESAVVGQLRGLLRAPEIIVATWWAARAKIEGLSESDVRDAIERFDPLWGELFSAEQARLVQLLVERVAVTDGSVEIRLRTSGLARLMTELHAEETETRRAA